jgi:hypothetical protein
MIILDGYVIGEMQTIRTKRDLEKIDSKETALRCHYYLTLPFAKHLQIVVPNLRVIFLPPSVRRNKEALKLLKDANVRVVCCTKRGPKPKHDKRLVIQAKRLIASGASYRTIADSLSVPKSTAHYLAKKRKPENEVEE